MKRFITLKQLLAASFVIAGLAFAGTSDAVACDHCTWKTVVVYVPVEKAYTYQVVRYDHCDKPYYVTKVGYKTVQVPVSKRVKVCY